MIMRRPLLPAETRPRLELPLPYKALKDGTVQALVAQQPATIGTDGLDQAIASLDGGTVTPKIQTGFTIITPENVDSSDAIYKSSC